MNGPLQMLYTTFVISTFIRRKIIGYILLLIASFTGFFNVSMFKQVFITMSYVPAEYSRRNHTTVCDAIRDYGG